MSWGLCVGVLGRFFVVYSLVCGSGISFVGCDCMTVDVVDINFTYVLPCIVIDLFLNNQPDVLIIQIYSVIKLYMFRASSLPIVRSFLLYIRHW